MVPRSPRKVWLLVALATLLAATVPASAVASPLGTPKTSAPCGWEATPPKVWTHVIWIIMENHSYNRIVGSPQAPYLNSLIPECGIATNYHNITHPSLPNYIATVTGWSYTRLTPYYTDCSPTGLCVASAPNLFNQVKSWKAYEESMPTNCDRSDAFPYYANGNPPPYFSNVSGCDQFDVPYTQFQTDLANDTLPQFSWITPNDCHQMEACGVKTGDTWLAHQIPMILSSPAYQSGDTAVFLFWDEGSQPWITLHCADNTRANNCHPPLIVISPTTPAGTQAGALYNHWSLLRTTEEMLGISHYLGHAASAASMRSAFDL